jgi:hypothetical protein
MAGRTPGTAAAGTAWGLGNEVECWVMEPLLWLSPDRRIRKLDNFQISIHVETVNGMTGII